MVSKIENDAQPGHPVTMGRRMAQGAVVGLLFISFFVFGVDNPNPDWPKLWIVKPLIMVPLAGTLGGILYHFINPPRQQRGWRRIGANILGLLVFLIVLWVGTVLGLNGTMWD